MKPTPATHALAEPKTPGRAAKRRIVTRGASIGALLLVGALGGGAVVAMTRPCVETAPLAPVAITSLAFSDGPVTIRGRVVEIFGHDAIVTDGTGRTMVDLGPRGDRGDLVSVGVEPLFQGRFDHGVLHATFLQTSPGHVIALAPPPPSPGTPEPQGAPGLH